MQKKTHVNPPDTALYQKYSVIHLYSCGYRLQKNIFFTSPITYFKSDVELRKRKKKSMCSYLMDGQLDINDVLGLNTHTRFFYCNPQTTGVCTILGLEIHPDTALMQSLQHERYKLIL